MSTVKNKLTWERIIDFIYLLVLLICPIIVIAGACLNATVGRSMLFIYMGVLYGAEVVLLIMLTQIIWEILQNPKKFMTEISGLYTDIMGWLDTVPDRIKRAIEEKEESK